MTTTNQPGATPAKSSRPAAKGKTAKKGVTAYEATQEFTAITTDLANFTKWLAIYKVQTSLDGNDGKEERATEIEGRIVGVIESIGELVGIEFIETVYYNAIPEL